MHPFFRGLQIKVNLINSLDRLLTFLDDEIVDALSYHLRETGCADQAQRGVTSRVAGGRPRRAPAPQVQ